MCSSDLNAQIGDATNEDFLSSLGVGNFDVCIVAIGCLLYTSEGERFHGGASESDISSWIDSLGL